MSLLPALISAGLVGCATSPLATPGVDPSIPAAPGEARAGVIAEGPDGEAALFGGVNAEGRAGDVKIYNDRVQLISWSWTIHRSLR